jgi:hypothetical protein
VEQPAVASHRESYPCRRKERLGSRVVGCPYRPRSLVCWHPADSPIDGLRRSRISPNSRDRPVDGGACLQPVWTAPTLPRLAPAAGESSCRDVRKLSSGAGARCPEPTSPRWPWSVRLPAACAATTRRRRARSARATALPARRGPTLGRSPEGPRRSNPCLIWTSDINNTPMFPSSGGGARPASGGSAGGAGVG